METVVHARIRCTHHIRKADKNIAKLKAALLEKEMRAKIAPASDVDPTALVHFKNAYNLLKDDTETMKDLRKDVNGLRRALLQIKEDQIGQLLYKSKMYYD